MYNLRDVRSPVRTPYFLLALLVAAFITLYPQLEAGGYCGDGSCPEVSHSAPASGALVASGASFVVAVLVAIPTIARAFAFRLALSAAPALVGITISPETPPPRLPF
jgi:hypothetical protein